MNALEQPRRSRRSPKGPNRARPRISLESLEDRCLLSIADPTANAPSLGAPPAPGPNVVWVDSDASLQSAVRNLKSNQTIVIKKGTYKLSNTLYVGKDANVKNVTIRGETDNFNDVVLVGAGMDNASYGNSPMGISVYNAQNVTIANLSVGNFYYHPIELKGDAGANAVSVYHVRLFDAGEQFIKSQPKSRGVGVNDSSVKYSLIEYTAGTPKTDHGAGLGYTNGIDVHAGKNWVISGNLIRGIHTPDSNPNLWGPAILVWNGASNIATEGNTFVNNDRAIAYGLSNGDAQGGIIRNNYILQQPGLFSSWRSSESDGQILVWGSTGTAVNHNTILTNGNSNESIQFRFTTTGSEARNNLTDAALRSRDGGAFSSSGNFTAATASMFVDAAAGDFHLVSNAATVANVIDKATVVSSATTDWDGQARPQGARADIGADEYFTSTSPGDTTAPTVTATSPASGATGVAVGSSVTATFSEAVQAGTIAFTLKDASGKTIAATSSYDAATRKATLKPSSALASSTTYTATLSGAKDAAGNAMTAKSWSFTTAAASDTNPQPTSSSIWSGSPTPADINTRDGLPLELGTRFYSDVDGTISGLRFYKADSAAATYTINLWSASGSRLATATVSLPSGTGWREASFSSPVAIKAGTTYVASFFTSRGAYASTPSYFRSRYDSGSLHVPANGGVFVYGSRSAFPNQTYNASNYWVDVAFNRSGGGSTTPPADGSTTPPADTTAPTVTATSPVANASGVPIGSSVAITFSEALASASVSGSTITLKDSAGKTIAAAVTYSAGNRTATLTPNSPLTASTKYTATVAGVTDSAGNKLANAYSWAFTTAAATSTPPPTSPPPSSSLGDLSKLPLLQQSNIEYVGAFRVPSDTVGASSIGYGGTALTFNPANNSLFIVGHPNDLAVAEIAIPKTIVKDASLSKLTSATFLQPFTKIIPRIPNQPTEMGGYADIGGLMVYNGQLVGTLYHTYDASGSVKASHFKLSSTNLSTATVSGMFQVGDMGGGFVGGSMSVIPEEWRSALGSPALTGLGGIAIISRSSYGPAAFGFDPDALRSGANPVNPYVYYDSGHQTLGGYDSDPPALFNGTAGGFRTVFVPETRSVLVFGSMGTGDFYYGEGADAKDSNRPGKAPHSVGGDYTWKVWAYDALDFVAAKNGQKKPWDVVPYATWDFEPLITTGAKATGGAAFDPATGRLYISELKADYQNPYAPAPIISVYQVTTGAAQRSVGTTSAVSTNQPSLLDGASVSEQTLTAATLTAPVPSAGEPVAPEASPAAPTTLEAASNDSQSTPKVSMAARVETLLRLSARGSSHSRFATNQAIKPTSWFGSSFGD